MATVNDLLAALAAQREANEGLAQEEQRQHAYNTRRSRGVIPMIGETIFDSVRKKQTKPEYDATLKSALDAQSGVDALIAQMQEIEARQAQAAQDSERFETEALYQLAGESRPNSALRARGHEPFKPEKEDQTALVQNLLSMGIDPRSPEGRKIMQENLTKGNTTLNVPSGYRPDGQGGLELTPGGPQWREAQDAADSEQQRTETRAYDSSGVVSAIDRAMENVGPLTAGWGGMLADVPSSDAKTLQGDLSTIEANLAFDRLTKMRNESKTGGALGQVSNIELGLLKSTWASLQQTQKPEDLRERLGLVRQHYQNFIDALNGEVPNSYNVREIPDKGAFIKVGDEWYPL